jgi:oligopeptidase B
LRDDSRSNPEVLSYLAAENAYTATYFKPLQPLIDALIHEMDGRLPAVEISSPSLRNGYVYYDVRGPGDDYWDTYRRPLLPQAAAGSNGSNGSSLAAAMAAGVAAAQGQSHCQPGNSSSSSSDELVLSQNSLSKGHTYWDVVKHEVSPNGRLVAYLYDTVGNEDFSLQVGGINPLFTP